MIRQLLRSCIYTLKLFLFTCSSSNNNTRNGVPQGSVLGARAHRQCTFIIMFNDAISKYDARHYRRRYKW